MAANTPPSFVIRGKVVTDFERRLNSAVCCPPCRPQHPKVIRGLICMETSQSATEQKQKSRGEQDRSPAVMQKTNAITHERRNRCKDMLTAWKKADLPLS